MITCHEIGRVVCQRYGITFEDLLGRSRRPKLARKRHMIWLLCREYTSASTVRLGQIFNRDHSTILFGVKSIRRHERSNPEIAEQLRQLRLEIGSRPDWCAKVRAEIEAERMAA